MADQPVSAAWIERYLSLLGVERERPSLDALTRLVRVQGETNVFENVTAILRRARVGVGPVPPLDLDALLAAREAGRGGGVCFELAPLFRQLLSGLGYRVQPILAQISFPGSHHATIVDLDDPPDPAGPDDRHDPDDRRVLNHARYLVDIGGGAPLWQPFRIGETVEIHHAGLGYRLRPMGQAEPDVYAHERWIDGGWQLFCRYELRPASEAVREAAYQRHQLAGETWVVGNLTMVRCTPHAVYRLRDDELVTYTADGNHTERLDGDADYRRVAANVFGLPELPIEEARAVLRWLPGLSS